MKDDSVRLIWATANGDELLAYMARVSNPSAQPGDPHQKLIKYLIDHKHWSPFEMVNMCVEINTERDISAQILRHKSFSFQEFSQRYAEVQLRPEMPNFRRQDTKNRQNSFDDLPEDTLREADAIAGSALVTSYRAYQQLINLGVAKECARRVLPMSTPTKIYMNGSVRSWIHYFDVRCDPATQLEHREIAIRIRDVFRKLFPDTAAAAGY